MNIMEAPKGMQKHWLETMLTDFCVMAEEMGFVVTVSQVPRQPLAMGSYDTLVEVREARKRAE
jgi:hypothetical protein